MIRHNCKVGDTSYSRGVGGRKEVNVIGNKHKGASKDVIMFCSFKRGEDYTEGTCFIFHTLHIHDIHYSMYINSFEKIID